MLLHRCPDLKELTLKLSSSHNNLQQVSRIAHGRWPHLSIFHIELWSHASSHYPHTVELGTFLSSHPWITDLGIYPHAGSSPPLVLAPTAMPYLTTFTGLCGQVLDLPNVYWLQSLHLLRQMPLPSSLVTGALQRLTSLTSLEICLDDAGDISLFCDVLSACPNLVTFNVSFWTTCNMVSPSYSLSANSLLSCPETAEGHLRAFAASSTSAQAYHIEDLPPHRREHAQCRLASPRSQPPVTRNPPRVGDPYRLETERQLQHIR